MTVGTNYYLHGTGCENACKHCAEVDVQHLGKSSAGWRFGFYAPPEWGREHAHTVWLANVETVITNGGHIEDEYGQRVTLKELLELIKNKQHLRSHLDPRPDERASWAGRNMADLYDSLQKSHFLSYGYDFSDRVFS